MSIRVTLLYVSGGELIIAQRADAAFASQQATINSASGIFATTGQAAFAGQQASITKSELIEAVTIGFPFESQQATVTMFEETEEIPAGSYPVGRIYAHPSRKMKKEVVLTFQKKDIDQAMTRWFGAFKN